MVPNGLHTFGISFDSMGETLVDTDSNRRKHVNFLEDG